MKRRNYNSNNSRPTLTNTDRDLDVSKELDSKRLKLSQSTNVISVKVKSKIVEIETPKSKILSSYEMSESGACKIFIETIQYELDGLLAPMSTPILRRHCAWKLVEICTSSIDSLHMLRAYGISNTLLRIAGLLISESDSYVRLCIQFLTLTICRDERGGINPSIQLPLNVFESITQSSIRHINHSKSENGEPNVGISTQTPSITAGFQRRKFGIKSKNSSPESLADSIQHLGQDVNFENCDKILKELSSKVPKLCSMLLDDEIYIDDKFIVNLVKHEELIALLGQTIVNRFLIAKIQNNKSSHLDSTESNGNIGGLLNDNKMDEFSSYQSSLRNNSLFYSANTEANSENQKSCAYSLLQHICIDVVHDIHIAKLELGNNRNKASPQVLMRLWQGLGIIEAACFRCLENQIHINSFTIPSTMLMTHSKYNCLLKHLMSLLKTLTPVLQLESEEILFDARFNNLDEDNLHGLFPELCIKVNNNSNKRDDSTAIKAKKVVKVSVRELWLSCLRVLVNLTTGCSEACAVLLNDSEDDIEYLFTILAVCLDWKNDEKELSSFESTEKSNIFSVLETALQKTAFDGSLFILTILTNIFESDIKSNKIDSIKVLLNMKLINCTNKANTGIDIDSSMITKLCYALAAWSRYGGSSQMNQEELTSIKLDVIHFLLALLARETSSFLLDIVATDDDFSKSTETLTDNCNTITPTESDGVSPKIFSKTTNNPTDQNENLPLAEIIIAAHLILLLHAIDSKVDHSIKKLLPRGTWWLGIRVLKAFLVLQGQSGVLIIDSAIPLLAALQSMKCQDHEIIPINTSILTIDADKISSRNGDDDIKNKGSTSSKCKGKWQWDCNIADFVWMDINEANPSYATKPQEISIKPSDINTEIANDNDQCTKDDESYLKQVLQSSIQNNDSTTKGYGKKRKNLTIEDIDAIGLV